REREGDHVSAQAARHRSRLVAGRAVGLVERDALPGRGPLERGDDGRVGLLGRGVGDQRELRRATAGGGRRGGAAARGQHQGGGEHREGGQRGGTTRACHSTK